MGEFDIIREYFAPLTDGVDGAYGLSDDAALIDNGPYIVTKDTIVAGVHFLPKDPFDLVARKLITRQSIGPRGERCKTGRIFSWLRLAPNRQTRTH